MCSISLFREKHFSLRWIHKKKGEQSENQKQYQENQFHNSSA